MMIDSLRSSVMRISLYNGWDKRWVEFKFAQKWTKIIYCPIKMCSANTIEWILVTHKESFIVPNNPEITQKMLGTRPCHNKRHLWPQIVLSVRQIKSFPVFSIKYPPLHL